MLGNLAEAVLTLGMLLILPGGLLVGVLLVRRLARSSRDRGDQMLTSHEPPVVYAIGSILVGGAAAFISLEAYLYGIVLAAATGALLVRWAGRNRWFALGGFLLGLGLCAAGFLSAALTNHDPAVTYDPSTIPTFWVGVFVALCGAVILVAATTAHPRREPA
jgi:uncharacterized membrane protein YidH (DUF202 family)